MNIGEKIRVFREHRGMTQAELGKRSNIYPATIRKYELGYRNPKQNQLIKIANGLGISVSVFYDLDISTLGDVASILFLIDEQSNIVFEGDKGSDGRYKLGSVSLRFENSLLNKFLADWADLKDIISRTKEASTSPDDTIDGKPLDIWEKDITRKFQIIQMQKMIMLDNKGGIKVKIRNLIG